jgi:uncharacterized protein (DUF2384 family)
MATVMIVDPKAVREARNILGFTQVQAGVALGNVRPETISRWERTPGNERPRMRGIHVETTRQLTQTADLLVELYPGKTDRMTFLNTPQRELGGQSPYDAIMGDPPYGLRDVVRLLGRMAEGIPT